MPLFITGAFTEPTFFNATMNKANIFFLKKIFLQTFQQFFSLFSKKIHIHKNTTENKLMTENTIIIK